LTITQRPVTHSGYPLGVVHPTRRTGRRATRDTWLRRGAAVAGSAMLIAGTALALSA
jgi:hypothetical protein